MRHRAPANQPKREPPTPWSAGGGGGSVSNLAVRHWTITAGLSTRLGRFVLGCVEEATQARDARASSVPPPCERTTPGLCSRISATGGGRGSGRCYCEGAACVHADV